MKALPLFAAILGLGACTMQETAVPIHNRGLTLPAVTPSYEVSVSNEIPALGRVLFYDPRLSETNDISCGSCHKQGFGFADNQSFSRGIASHTTRRNTLAIQNNAKSLFWDGREGDLRKMVLMPIMNDAEMGVRSLDAMVDELNSQPYYKELVRKAYGTDKLSEAFIADALSWFVKSIQPKGSRFDQHLQVDPVFIPGVEHKNSPFLSDQEMQGMKLFLEKYNCNRCHNLDKKPGPVPQAVYIVAGNEAFANIGLDIYSEDKGRREVTNTTQDDGRFRIPSLRNVALTAPYMHDGRFATLSDVIDHYAHNIQDNPNLDPNLRVLTSWQPPSLPIFQPRRFEISDTERQALIAFLNTLTDNNVVTNEKWSDPFRRR